ncbi:MAG: ABC transporter permease [Phycisphaeraceae bacterium]
MGNGRLLRNIHLGVKNLLLHKLRSLLTMLGVVFGVASVVAMLAVGEGASAETMAQIRKLGSENIIISSTKPSEEAASGSQRSRTSMYGLTYTDLDRLRQTLPRATQFVPAKQLPAEGRLGRRVEPELRVVGTTQIWFELLEREMIAGRPLLARDMRGPAAVTVLTESGARKLLATEHAIGESVRLGGGYYKVVGIVKSESVSSGSVQTPDTPRDAYIPLHIARERFGDMIVQRSSGSFQREQVELHQIIIRVDDEAAVEPAAAAIESTLDRFHRKEDYRISVPLALLEQARAARRTFNIVLGSIAGISLLVGGIGIMNIMLASVTERTREIGVRRAIGARRGQIITQFLIETVVLSSVGGLIGMGLGVGIPALITAFAGMPTVVTPTSLVLSVGISVSVGIVFGLYPAYRAANLDPIVALRHE